MILSDREIRSAVERGLIGITPCPPPQDNAWSPTTLDLTLDAEIRAWTAPAGDPPYAIIDPTELGISSDQLIREQTSVHDCTEGFVIEPRMLVLGWTIEMIKLPYQSRIAARVEGKSSLARIGLGIHVTAPTIHPGFGVKTEQPDYPGSPIRLEIWNVNPCRSIRLNRGIRICQIVFEEVHGTPEQGYAGQFQIQGPPQPPPAS